MNKRTEAVQLMDLLKKRHLQIEYLEKSNQFTYSDTISKIEDIDSFVDFLKEDIKYMERYIPEAILDFLDTGDYEIYTLDNYRNKFWNEIELPEKVQRYFDIFQKLMGCESTAATKYELQFYDLYLNSLFFESLEALETFIQEEDFAPFTVYEINGKSCIELYSA